MWVLRSTLWMLSWVGVLSIGGVIATTCTQGDHDSWKASLFILSPVNVGILAGLLIIPRTSRGIALLTVPHLLLVPISAIVVCQYLLGTTIQGHHLCAIHSDELGFDRYGLEWWYRYWAPIQAMFLASYVTLCIREWRTVSEPPNKAINTDA